LLAESLQKMKLDLCFRGEFQGMKVQQMTLDRERVRAERWPVADIRDRVKAFAAHANAGDVNAVSGNHLLIPAQINGRNGVFRSIASPPPGGRQDTECPA